MKLDEAHRILDTQKDGTRLHPVINITEALWVTGDISRSLPIHARPFDSDGINEWMESSRMAQGERTGDTLPRDLSGNQSRLDNENERK